MTHWSVPTSPRIPHRLHARVPQDRRMPQGIMGRRATWDTAGPQATQARLAPQGRQAIRDTAVQQAISALEAHPTTLQANVRHRTDVAPEWWHY